MRWLSIRMYKVNDNWVWADYGGWGATMYKSFWRTLWGAIKGEF